MMRYLITLICFFLCNVSLGQIVVNGTLRNAQTKEAITDANVMLQRKGATSILCFTMSDQRGQFTLKFSPTSDTLNLIVSGMGVKPYKREIKAINQFLEIDITHEVTQIREVIVKAEPIRRTSDTLNFSVSQFTDQGDRSIGDVLKKMPGIEVSVSGQIKYHGKNINKFYIEGLDMLGGRYGIATTNVSAKDIATVQVLENHQPINILKGKAFTNQAAINLKLKESVKGTWNGNIQAGAGYKPILWNGEAVAMMFARKFQTINTYKGNNNGNDVSRELKSFYGGVNEDISMLGIIKPYTPQIEKQRYLENRINSGSINSIWKLAKNYTLTLNATYLNDRQIFRGNSRTTYFLPENKTLDIDENIFSRYKINQATVDLLLQANTEKLYLSNKLQLGAMWNVDDGSVTTPDKHIWQGYYRPKFDVINRFNIIKNIKTATIFIYSSNSFSTSPASLEVTPMLYSEFFKPGEYNGLAQTLQVTNFHSITEAETSFKKGYFNHGYRIGFDADLQWLNSAFAPIGGVAPDSMVNDQYYSKLKYYFTPNFSFVKNGSINISLNLPIYYQSLILSDKSTNQKPTRGDLLINPNLNLIYTITPSFKINLSGLFNRSIGSQYESYSGYIMNNYRSVSNREGIISDNKNQRYTVALNYGNAIYSLFGTLEGVYWRTNSNLMYDTEFIGTLSQIKSYAIANLSQGYSLLAKASKRIEPISTTISATGSYDKSYRDLLRQGQVLNTTNDMISVGGAFSTRFGTISRLDYEINWAKSFTKTFGSTSSFAPIEVINQKAILMFFITKMLTIKLSGEHFFNNAIADGSRSIFFVDAYISYKTKRFEYMIEGCNLLNTKEFYNATYGDAMGYRYIYGLRPTSVMAKVKFYIK